MQRHASVASRARWRCVAGGSTIVETLSDTDKVLRGSFPSQGWFVYLIRGATGRLYCGITTDICRRLREHNHQRSRSSKAVWAMRPVQLVWSEAQPDRSTALRREAAVKRLSRAAKEALIATG